MTQEQWFDGLPVSQLAKEEFVPQHGALVRKYVAANDNVPATWEELAQAATERFPVVRAALARSERVPLERPPFQQFQPHEAIDDNLITDQPPLEPPRVGDWIQTYSARKFWPMDPRPEEVHIEDIAHSLALQCRYAGHCLRFYSVAEHSVLMARHLAPLGPYVAMWALLHDASEAYLVDVPRPVKPFLDGYVAAEKAVMDVIARRFGLSIVMPSDVHSADGQIIADELANMKPMAWHARYAGKELGVQLQYWSPDEAETEFLAEYVRLERKLGRV
jgi:hypothetical protein